MAWSLWLVICTLGPMICLSAVHWEIPYHYFIGIKNKGKKSSLRIAAVCIGIVFAFAVLVGIFCGLEVALLGSLNVFTVTVVSLLAAAFALGACLIYDGIICKFVQNNELEEIDLAKQKIFMFFVMVLQIPMLSHLLGFITTYGLDTFLGWFGLIVAIGLAITYAVSFWT
jgi:hypothetical protein